MGDAHHVGYPHWLLMSSEHNVEGKGKLVIPAPTLRPPFSQPISTCHIPLSLRDVITMPHGPSYYKSIPSPSSFSESYSTILGATIFVNRLLRTYSSSTQTTQGFPPNVIFNCSYGLQETHYP